MVLNNPTCVRPDDHPPRCKGQHLPDFDNRLKAADVDQDGTPEIRYTYDALGRRVSKTIPSTKKNREQVSLYVCATSGGTSGGGQQVVAEYTVELRTQGGGQPDTPVLAHKTLWGTYIDDALMVITVIGGAENQYHAHTNRLYCITALTDATGAVVERYAYTPYGAQTILSPTGTPLATSAIYITSNVLGHQGLMHDQETGLIYNRARMLDAELGRFIQRDMLGYVDGLSLYAYYAGMGGGVDWSGASANGPDPAAVTVDAATAAVQAAADGAKNVFKNLRLSR